MPIFRRRKKPVTTELIVPKHVAIIMDGNGRWAQARGLPRIEGHRQGAQSVRRACEVCVEMGVQVLTLYCFSSENWKRPKEELDFLMKLLKQFLTQESKTLLEKNIRLTVIGRRDGLPSDVLEEMDLAIAKSASMTGLHLCLAINYGSRQEITDAVRSIAREVRAGTLAPDQIDETTISQHLYTADLPDPDLLIRTSGELRLSNYLLWQISYSELWITKRAWPEFSREDFLSAIEDYSKRHRRFGGL
ncbi:MAG: isoprenyl transferase [Pirellula sp.]|jgi:undecaprenyl diphosphate synthase|nr:isoprenyl transferase [Pirellula sp.]